MKIVNVGTSVITKIGQIKAIITGVCIREQSIDYQISYFSNAEHKTAWIYRFEFDIDASEKKQAGFVNYQKPTDESDYILLD